MELISINIDEQSGAERSSYPEMEIEAVLSRKGREND
jgi:hypothetical protein